MSDNPASAFAEALAEFQAALPHIGKGSTADTGSFSYSYADLTAVTDAALPLLSKVGLAFTATPTMTDRGFVLRCALCHVGGYREEGGYPLPDPTRATPQQLGSAITYARRYSLLAMTGLAPGGDDDDGAQAKNTRAADPLAELKRRIVTAGKACGLETVEALTAEFANVNGGLVLTDATQAELEQFLAVLDAKAGNPGATSDS